MLINILITTHCSVRGIKLTITNKIYQKNLIDFKNESIYFKYGYLGTQERINNKFNNVHLLELSCRPKRHGFAQFF